MGRFLRGHLCGGHFNIEVMALGEWQGRGVVFFVGPLFVVLEVCDCKKVFC